MTFKICLKFQQDKLILKVKCISATRSGRNSRAQAVILQVSKQEEKQAVDYNLQWIENIPLYGGLYYRIQIRVDSGLGILQTQSTQVTTSVSRQIIKGVGCFREKGGWGIQSKWISPFLPLQVIKIQFPRLDLQTYKYERNRE